VAALPAADLEQVERQRLVNALENLQRQSISSTCKALVARHADPEQVKAFASAHRTRSSLLHSGQVPPENHLDETVFVLDQIVAFCFADRAFCAALIFARASADIVRVLRLRLFAATDDEPSSATGFRGWPGLRRLTKVTAN